MTHVRVEIDAEKIATIWLDAPGKRVNTLSRAMWADLSAAIEQVERDKPVGLIVTSAKRHSFVVGADLFEIRDMTDEQFDEYIRLGQQILLRIERLPIPTVAVINGDCVGGGLELALACKVRLAIEHDPSDHVVIGLPETRLGLIPGWGGTVRLLRLIGVEAIRLIIDGSTLPLQQAKAAGIVEELVTEAEWKSLAHRLVLDIRSRPLVPQKLPASHARQLRDLADNPASIFAGKPATAAGTKLVEVIRERATQGEQAAFDAERRAIIELRRTPDSQRLIQEFCDRKKRPKT